MPVSPQDFELYSRVTGRPMPRSRQEEVALAPEVFKFTRNFARGGQESQEPSFLQQVLGGLGNAALLGAGASAIYGLSRATGRNSSENNIPPNSAGVTSGMGEPPTRVGQKGFVRTTNVPENDQNYGNQKIDPAIEAKYSIARNEAPLHLANRFEKMAYIGEDQATSTYEADGIAALDQAFENAVALDNARESTYGIPAGREVGNIGSLVTLPEAVIEASPQKSQGLISAINQEAQDFDHNIPYGERTKQALESDSALGAAGIIAGTIAEKGAKDVGTRARKIVTGVPQSINTVRNIASGIGDTVTREVINASIIPDNKMQPSKWAEAARLAAGFAPLGGSGGVEINYESDLSDNAQVDDPHQQNEQATPAGINRQTSGLAPDPVEGEMQTIGSAVNDLAANLGKGLAHLSPEERVDIARKMIEKDLRKEGYKGPINFG